MSGITTQSTERNFNIIFNTNDGKKKSMKFKQADTYSSDLATKLINIANAMIANTGAFRITLTSIDALTHNSVTKTVFSEANS